MNKPATHWLMALLIALTIGTEIYAINYTPSIVMPALITTHLGCAAGLCGICRWIANEDPEGGTQFTDALSRLLWPVAALFFVSIGVLIVLAHR